MNIRGVWLSGTMLALVLLGCKKDTTGDARGPMEKAGAWVDDAAKKTGEGVEKAAEETGKGMEKAGKKVENTFDSGSGGSSSSSSGGK